MLPPLNIAKGRTPCRLNLNCRCELANTCPPEQAPAPLNSASFLTCSHGVAILQRRCLHTVFCQSTGSLRRPARSLCATTSPRLCRRPRTSCNSTMMHCSGLTARNTGGRAERASKSLLAPSLRRTPVGATSSAPSAICAARSCFPRRRRAYLPCPPGPADSLVRLLPPESAETESVCAFPEGRPSGFAYQNV